jgi:hypothetical protein
MTENTPKYNARAITWSQKVRLLLKSKVTVLSSKGKGELAASVRTKTKKDYGEIERIDFVFSRHGVFFQKGAGRGYKVQSGKVMRNPGAGGKVITARRKPKDWLTPVNEHINELANIVAAYHADNAVDVIVKT